MALFDANDFARRIMALYPQPWLSQPALTITGNPDTNGLFAAIAHGLGVGLSSIYSELAYVKAQSRLLSSTDVNIDQRAADYFGGALPRQFNEPDAAYIARIQAYLISPKPTIAGLQSIITSFIASLNYSALGGPLSLDVSGALDDSGALDMPMASNTTLSAPIVTVFDCQSNPALAAQVGLVATLGQFCVLFTFPNSAAASSWALGQSTLGNSTYLAAPSIYVLAACPSPALDVVIRQCKAEGTVPVYAANHPQE